MTDLASDDFSEITKVPLFGIPLEKLPTYRKVEPVGNAPVEKHEGINIALLQEIMTFIKDHPTTWYQESWFRVVDRKTGMEAYVPEVEEVTEVNSCGTSFCFAGHVALAQGFPAPPKLNHIAWERPVDGSWYNESVEEFAQKVLGLTSGQADALFDSENTMEDLERMVQTLILIPMIAGYHLKDIQDSVEDDTSFMEYLLNMAQRYNHKKA